MVVRDGNQAGLYESVTVKDKVVPGDTVRVMFTDNTDEQEERVEAVEGSVDILYEDEDVVVLNKPTGIVSHPSHGHHKDSLANYLAGYYKRYGKSGRFRVVGRLDKDTSGAILFAKNAPAAARLFRQKEDGVFRKTYLAVCANPPKNNEKRIWNVIDDPIGPIPGTLMKQQIMQPPEGKSALTRYICRGSFDHGCVMEAEIDTGRTHQIRVHLASVGHPLIGDKLYGEELETGRFADRALLHAWKMTFRHPFGSEIINITAPIPDDMEKYL
ncbi:MAG: RluA family pseudouridine synthase [Lachnospiraceae bacterium]|nr:RluA family pseudouridine synthase [Lachnospiraceae bacterium]